MGRRFLFGAAVAGTLWATSPGEARAQANEDYPPVRGTAKGIVGGALLGAEIVMMPMGIAGLKPWWPYLVFGGLGSVGGAIGGWAVEQQDPPAEAPLYMLAGGLALVIPTIVLTLNATTREDFGEEEDPSTLTRQPDSTDPLSQPVPGEQPTVQPGPDGTTVLPPQSRTPKRRRVARPSLPLAFLDLDGENVRFGIPNVAVTPLYTTAQLQAFAVEQGTVVDIPVFRSNF
jgi:hypothetical protein